MTRKRKLRQEEVDLWQSVARSTKPLRPKSKIAMPTPTPSKKEQADPPAPLPPFSMGEKANHGRSTTAMPKTTAARLASDPVQMDNKAYGKLKRGKLKPEARIDLHGLTLERAHPRLTGFILDAQARGLRLVLVITGKGGGDDPYDPAPTRRGVLRRQVPVWLRQGALAGAVLQITPAHIRHGGEGAYYVYLRKRR